MSIDAVYQALKDNSSLRKKYMRRALPSFKGCEVLFLLAVDQYNKSPNKKRAIATYEVFIEGLLPGVAGSNSPLTINLYTSPQVLQTIKQTIDIYKSQRDVALGMSFLKRVGSSGARKALPFIFDHIAQTIRTDAELGNDYSMHYPKILSQPQGKISAIAPPHIKKLKDAGFNMGGLGLN